MYCPNCGAESTFGLNYCKHCGGNLSEMPQPGSAGSRNILAALILALATLGIVLGGLGIVFTNALALVASQPPGFSQPGNGATRLGGVMIVFGCTGIVLVALMLIRLFSRMMGFGPEVGKQKKTAKAFARQQQVPQMQAPPIVVSSVTEHTTRNFEPRIYQRDTSE